MPNLFDFGLVWSQIPEILTYLPVTLEIALISMAASLVPERLHSAMKAASSGFSAASVPASG